MVRKEKMIMKYIDFEKLKANLENLYDNMLKRIKIDKDNSDYWEGKADAYRNVIDAINSLQQEQQEEMNEDFFFDEVLKVYDDNDKYPPKSEEELTMLEIIARRFYELGLNARKEE